MKKFSIVTRIGVALSCIVAMALSTMLISYWLSEKADSDALAINVAGSLRMQTYKVALLSQQQKPQELAEAQQKLLNSWQHPVFYRMKHEKRALSESFRQARHNWLELSPQISSGELAGEDLARQIASHVALLEGLVGSIQQDAEQKVRALRLVQVVALFLTVILAMVVMYWLKSRVEQPLSELTRAARRIGQGDFTSRLSAEQPDELGVLAGTLNKMSDAIAYMYGNLEKRVDEQTAALQQSNTKLQFLYDMARSFNQQVPDRQQLNMLVERLQQVTHIRDIELCLITEQGSAPYLQLQPADVDQDPCSRNSCEECIEAPTHGIRRDEQLLYRYQLKRDHQQYGVLVARSSADKKLAEWQQQLLSTVADQLAIAMSLKSEAEQSRRLALMQERTVIARELHDSLAQALSYLKIQVSRLNKAISLDDKASMQDVSLELKHGLDAAYRQLRELLTTFRLKVDGGGLQQALQLTATQLSEQSGMKFSLDYQLTNTPLQPQEEIHLLQIVREASQNAVHHSQGSEVVIRLAQQQGQAIELAIEDNGIGIAQHAEKLNHYGLAIMQERSKQLGGAIQIRRREQGGTGVYFSFTPEYLQQQPAQVE
ncbi:ATP-binding protein [Rheinheimera sp.]|uniref:ATP-binding protein n=1 Tax=Rheinheimera sp. TaxID=1869214 RepID=UPI0027BAB5EC|nr:ATP-binding protein [Rheinheimera sp.]